MKNGLFEYGDAVIITAINENGIINIQQMNENDSVEVKLQSGVIEQFNTDDLEYDLDYQPDTGE